MRIENWETRLATNRLCGGQILLQPFLNVVRRTGKTFSDVPGAMTSVLETRMLWFQVFQTSPGSSVTPVTLWRGIKHRALRPATIPEHQSAANWMSLPIVHVSHISYYKSVMLGLPDLIERNALSEGDDGDIVFICSPIAGGYACAVWADSVGAATRYLAEPLRPHRVDVGAMLLPGGRLCDHEPCEKRTCDLWLTAEEKAQIPPEHLSGEEDVIGYGLRASQFVMKHNLGKFLCEEHSL